MALLSGPAERPAGKCTTVLWLTAAAALLSSCDNGAVGVDACRRLEQRKCELALQCPNAPSIQSPLEVDACKLFYRDQCMFGMADVTSTPDEAAVDDCITALEAARACHDQGLELASCSSAPEISAQLQVATGCEAVMAPQALVACGFLAPPVDDTSAGGTTAAGGSGGGASGGGGSA